MEGADAPMKEEIATETWEDVNSIMINLLEYGVYTSDRVVLTDMR